MGGFQGLPVGSPQPSQSRSGSGPNATRLAWLSAHADQPEPERRAGHAGIADLGGDPTPGTARKFPALGDPHRDQRRGVRGHRPDDPARQCGLRTPRPAGAPMDPRNAIHKEIGALIAETF